jgi:hypothetical protein
MPLIKNPSRLLVLYFATFLGSVAVVGALCLAVNMLIDPLWYFRGNVVTGVNYAFNERMGKINRFLPQMAEYDCLLIGSSHTALLPAQRFQGHRCYNMGFSHGRVQEFLAFAKYLRNRGARLALITVNVDLYDFTDPPAAITVPDFIQEARDPRPFWLTYVTLDVLNFSYRTLRGAYPNHLIYDDQGHMHIIPKRRFYRPPRQLIASLQAPTFHAELADAFVELRRLYPEAKAIGWAPPVSAWTIARLKLDGLLPDYLEALRKIAANYDEFIDFSIPSTVTASTNNTYDGIHYTDDVNAQTVDALSSGHPGFGIDWRRNSFAEIAALYDERLATLIPSPAKIAEPASPPRP